MPCRWPTSIKSLLLFPITRDNQTLQEEKELTLLQQLNVKTIVLARYMRILSPQFVARYPEQIINIHHSFCPLSQAPIPISKLMKGG